MPTRTANAQWDGALRDGSGTMKMASGSYEGPFSFQSRFKEGEGTNPEELIAAAHAGCFSMQFSGELAGRGATSESVRTEARVELSKVEGGFEISRIDLITRVRASGIDEAAFQEAAQAAKANCPVSQALKAVDIAVDASLES
jgi:osmotically inducible protein OsmC